jgi:hypothetical protein
MNVTVMASHYCGISGFSGGDMSINGGLLVICNAVLWLYTKILEKHTVSIFRAEDGGTNYMM